MDYIITSHKGAGKSKLAVSEAVKGYLMKGKRVASNITINLDKAMRPESKVSMIKLPYIPNESHLNALGLGYPELNLADPSTYDEDKFGLVILDEAGKWMNARQWNDKERKGLFNWLTHARKYGWDVYTIVQDLEALDAQIRRSIMECHVNCSRLDRVKVPYLPVRLPKVFRATARYGGPEGFTYKTWHATDEANTWYNTSEAVKEEVMYTEDGVVDMRANFTLLSAWHLVGRYLPKPASRWNLLPILTKWLVLTLLWPFSGSGRSPDLEPRLRRFQRDMSVVFPRILIDLGEVPYPPLPRATRAVTSTLVACSLEEYNRRPVLM